MAKVLYSTGWLLWRAKWRFLEALLIPFAIMLTIWWTWAAVADDISAIVGWLFYALLAISFCIIAMVTHRLVILGPDGVPKLGIRMWGMRETRFVSVFFALYGGFYLLISLISLVYEGKGVSALAILGIFSLILVFGYGYIFARLSVLFPSIAIGNRIDVKKAWNMTDGNSFPLFILVIILPWIQDKVYDWIISLQPPVWISYVTYFFGLVLFVAEVIILSYSYKALKEINE